MIKIISERHIEYRTIFELQFDLKGWDKGDGYSFPLINGNTEVVPCKQDENTLDYVPCSEEECPWWENYLKVKNNIERYEEPYISKLAYSYIVPAKAICYCGNEIYLNGDRMGVCQCSKCGRRYNMFGQKLNDPDTWEEDYEY